MVGACGFIEQPSILAMSCLTTQHLGSRTRRPRPGCAGAWAGDVGSHNQQQVKKKNFGNMVQLSWMPAPFVWVCCTTYCSLKVVNWYFGHLCDRQKKTALQVGWMGCNIWINYMARTKSAIQPDLVGGKKKSVTVYFQSSNIGIKTMKDCNHIERCSFKGACLNWKWGLERSDCVVGAALCWVWAMSRVWRRLVCEGRGSLGSCKKRRKSCAGKTNEANV